MGIIAVQDIKLNHYYTFDIVTQRDDVLSNFIAYNSESAYAKKITETSNVFFKLNTSVVKKL